MEAVRKQAKPGRARGTDATLREPCMGATTCECGRPPSGGSTQSPKLGSTRYYRSVIRRHVEVRRCPTGALPHWRAFRAATTGRWAGAGRFLQRPAGFRERSADRCQLLLGLGRIVNHPRTHTTLDARGWLDDFDLHDSPSSDQAKRPGRRTQSSSSGTQLLVNVIQSSNGRPRYFLVSGG